MYKKNKSENFNDFFFGKNSEPTPVFDAGVCDCTCVCSCQCACDCDRDCSCDCSYCDCDTSSCSSGSCCFITTATLTSLGKDDDCIELTAFRQFRDTYLKNKFEDEIQEYYRIAPPICKKIDEQTNSKEIYLNLYDEYISKGYALLLENKSEEAHILYKQMIKDLITRKY